MFRLLICFTRGGGAGLADQAAAGPMFWLR